MQRGYQPNSIGTRQSHCWCRLMGTSATIGRSMPQWVLSQQASGNTAVLPLQYAWALSTIVNALRLMTITRLSRLESIHIVTPPTIHTSTDIARVKCTEANTIDQGGSGLYQSIKYSTIFCVLQVEPTKILNYVGLSILSGGMSSWVRPKSSSWCQS